MKLVILIFIWLAAVFTVSGQSQYFRVVNGIPCMPVLSNSSDVTNPETGSFFYSTDDNSFYFYTGSSWVGLCSFSSPVLSTGREWFRVVDGIPAFPLLNPLEVAEVAVPGTAFYSSTGVIQVNDGAGWKSIFDYGNTENVSENVSTAMGTVNGGSGLFTIPVLASEPSSPGTGAFYFDAAVSALRVYNGTAWLDIDCGNCAPQVVGVTFTEDATNFIAGYTYYDKEGDAENSVTVQWYVADDDQGANSTLLSEVNDLPQADFYALHNQKYLRAVVVAQAQDGNLYSDEAFSEWVAYADCVPQVTSVAIVEDLTEFNARYMYYDKEDDVESSADVQWYVADDAQGTNSILISEETALSRPDFYSLYDGKYLQAVVVARAETGNPNNSDADSSGWVLYTNCVPQVTGVTIAEDVTSFNAGYTYYDKEEDVESGSADVQWYVADDAQGTNSTLLSEETALSRPDFYSLYDEKYLQAVVVARAETGNPNNSDADSSGWVLYTNCVPQVTGVTIAEDVTSFNAGYTYYDKEEDVESGSADVQWYVADDAQGTNSTLLSENPVLSRPDFYSLYDGKYLQAVVVVHAGSGNPDSQADSSQWVAYTDCVPQVTSVAIVEDLTEFNARYMYYDKEDDAESSADVQWYVADDAQGTNSTLLSENPALSRPDFYSLYDGKYLQAVVVSRAGTGNPNNSDADSSGWVLYTNCVPQVTGVTIAEDETSFNAAYAYYDKEGDNESGSADVQWYVADDAQGTNSTLLSENPVLSRPDFYSLYDGKYLQAVVVSRAGTGNLNNSDADSSQWVAYTDCVPQVTSVAIVEDLTEFNARYMYYDKEDDAESSADVQWYVADDAQGTNSTLLSENSVLSRPDFYSLYNGKYLQAVVVVHAESGNPDSQAASSEWIAYTNCVPQVTGVSVAETETGFIVGYAYYDKEGDAESNSVDVQWYVADDAQGTNSTLISEETVLPVSGYFPVYYGKYLQAVVVVHAQTGNPNDSEAAFGEWISYVGIAPEVTDVTVVEGTTDFYVEYVYYDREGDAESGGADVKWYVADNAQGTNSTLISEDSSFLRSGYSSYNGKYMKAVVVAHAQSGIPDSDEASSVWKLYCPVSVTVKHVSGSVSPQTVTITYPMVKTTLGSSDGSDYCWIAQNLGATAQPSVYYDYTVAASGWYWQFNRKQGYYYNGSRTPNTTWVSSISQSSNWSAANDPCTLLLGSSWRLPTKTEWENVVSGWTDSSIEPYASVLKLHPAGFLRSNDGVATGRGGSRYYWSSTQSSSTSANGVSGIIISSNFQKEIGLPLRCLMELE